MITAGKLMIAVHSVYESRGDEEYARKKTNNFLARCGVKIENGPEQEVDFIKICDIANAALDEDAEFELITKLKIGENIK
jgi:hypothetical protein